MDKSAPSKHVVIRLAAKHGAGPVLRIDAGVETTAQGLFHHRGDSTMQRRCDCPRGGQITCESHQVGYCMMVAGERFSGCLAPPAVAVRDLSSALRELLEWTLNELDFSLSREGGDNEIMLLVLEAEIGHERWPARIREGMSLEFSGWVRVDGELKSSDLSIRVPEPFDNLRRVHGSGHAPA